MSGAITLGPEQRRAISNERVKLLAAALDRTSTACIVVGIFGPFTTAATGMPTAMGWLLGAVALHYLGNRTLGFLR